MSSRICLLGIRGSIPVSGPEYEGFGCATSCMVVYSGEMPKEAVVIDAGTGLLNIHRYMPESVTKLHILLSHIHLDHIQGLLMLPEMFDGRLEIDIYSGKHNGGPFYPYLCDMMKPPIWPVTPQLFSKKVRFLDLPESPFEIGDITVKTMSGSHPDDIDIFHLTFKDGSTLVHVGDYEVGANPDTDEKLKDFAKGANLLLMDGMYSDEEYSVKRGFGHSSWNLTAALAEQVGVKRTRIIHHSPDHSDEILRKAEAGINARYANTAFGREGEIIELCGMML